MTALDALAAERPVDLPLHASHGGHDVRIETGPEDEGSDQLEESIRHLGVARAEARLDQGLALPELGALGQVGLVAVERQDDPAHPALGTEPEIHAEGVPFLGHRLEGGHDVPRHGGEVVAVREAALRSARGLPVLSIDEDEVDVGGIVQLIAAELAHADDGEAGGRAVGSLGDAEALAETLLGPPPRGLQAHVGEARELFRGHRQVGVSQQVAGAYAQELAILEPAERVPARVEPLEGARGLLEGGGELVAMPLPHGLALEKPREERRMPAQRVGEELARAPEPRHEVERARVRAEETEQSDAIALGGQALQVVERHVGIGRLRQRPEQPREERGQELGVARLRRERVQVDQRRARDRKAEALELGQRLSIVRSRGEQVHGDADPSALQRPLGSSGVRWPLRPSRRCGCGWRHPWAGRRPCRRRWSRCGRRTR